MITSANRDADRAAIAARELMQLEKQIEKARVLLARLQAGLVDAGNKLGGEAALLVEANQQLVLSALRAQTQAEITARSAELDGLTRLPNRTVFLDRFEQAIVVAKRRDTCLALLFLDINNFKDINDTLGHGMGDKVLQHVAICLTAVVRKADTVSRHGGDEFLILLAEITQMSDAMLIADKIHAALVVPSQADDQIPSLTASIGISLYPEHGADADLLIERADVAMYHAKRHGLGSYVYTNDEISSSIDYGEAKEVSTSARLRTSSIDLSHAHPEHLREANEHLIVATLTAQNLQMEAEQARHRQSTFLAVLAHELRNPLGPLRMAAALLGRTSTDSLKLQELQHLISRQVTRMARLLDDLFDVARVNSGKLTVVKEALDINVLIQEVTDIYVPVFEKRRQIFEVEKPVGEVFIEGDACRLTQIFSNLLENAAKYTPVEGQIKLSAVIKAGKLVTTFADNGIGIIATALPHIFEPFIQDSAATEFNDEGLGIGLAVVRELVEAHGGTVTAHSAGSNLGSQFIVTLPLLNAAV